MPSLKQQELAKVLNQFYQKPIAMVSLELLLSFGLVIVLGIFAIQPTLLTMSDLIKEIDDKKALDTKLQSKVQALATAQNVYTAVEPRLQLIDEAIPSQPQLVTVLKILEKLATDNKVILVGVTSSTIPDEVTPDLTKSSLQRVSMPIVVSIVGDYPSIRTYVGALLAMRRIFIIQSVSFTIQENRGEKKLQASITLNVPYFGVKQK